MSTPALHNPFQVAAFVDLAGPEHPTFKAFVDQPWVDEALCAQTDPEAFFPDKGGSTRVAKATCAKCFVQAECLDWALTTNERFGIWGGLSERERRAINATTACPDCGDTFTTIHGVHVHQSAAHTNTERTVAS